MICTDFSVIQLTRSLCSLLKIKEEPIDEEYKEYFSFSISAEDIKDEPKVAKVGHTIRFIGWEKMLSSLILMSQTGVDAQQTCCYCIPTLFLVLTGGLADRFSLLLHGTKHIHSGHWDQDGFDCVLLQLQKCAGGRRNRLSEEEPCRNLLLISLPFEFLPNETS